MDKKYFLGFLLSLLLASGYSQSGSQITEKDLQTLFELSYEAVNQYDYNNSIQYSLELIKLASEENEYYYLYHAYNVLGISYEDMNDTDRAKDNYVKALKSAKESKNDTILWWAYNNLANILTENAKTVEQGFEYYDKAIDLVSNLNIEEVLTPILNKGWTHLDYAQYDRAYPYLLRAKKLVDTLDRQTRAQLHTLFGMYYAGKGVTQKAHCYFESAVKIVEEDSLLIDAAFTYKEHAKMLSQIGYSKEAYEALERHLFYQGKIFEQEKLHQMEAAYSRYETNAYRKDLELARLEQENKDEIIAKTREVTLIMIIFLIVMLVFLILLYRNNRVRRRLIAQLKEKNKELMLAKDEAERLSMLKTKFFSTVSHELRTPLYGVVGLTSLLLEDNTNKKQIEDLKSLKFSADYLLALINDVLQMNKMESKLVNLESMPFNIEDLMGGIVKSFEFTRHQNRNTIELHIDKKIPKNLIGDSVRLSQIIMNLVGNAIKFTERGKVWIKATCKKCEDSSCLIYFEIGDTGIGIPNNKQQEIFEEFSQLRSNNYSYQGTGLGLPIVKKLLNLFGTEIGLRSEERKGSVFYFEILFQEGEKSTETSIGDENLPEKTNKKALIVDDNRINQVVTQRILEKRDFECKVVSNGFEAIEILKEEHVDVVLMDVNMPGMSGMEASREVRTFNKTVPIIALTAVEIEEVREEILGAGMNDIIVKPYDTHQFFQTVFRNLLVPTN